MIHYHGTPFTPKETILDLAGRHFCVAHSDQRQVEIAHQIGQSVMLDNGAYSAWKAKVRTNWPRYYAWTDRWLDFPTTWAVIPDVIGGEGQDQDALIAEWPHGHRGAPVWHMDEGVYRLLNLIDRGWPKVCIGSTPPYQQVLSDLWCERMTQTWNAVEQTFKRTPWIHMLRGMQLSGMHYPFASVDSTEAAQNQNRGKRKDMGVSDMVEGHHANGRARASVERWDSMQTPARWVPRAEQMDLAV